MTPNRPSSVESYSGPSLASKARLKAIAALYEESEEDAAKRAGLVGYLCYLARNHPRSYVSLLARVLPLQIKMEAHETVNYRSTQEILQSTRRCGYR